MSHQVLLHGVKLSTLEWGEIGPIFNLFSQSSLLYSKSVHTILYLRMKFFFCCHTCVANFSKKYIYPAKKWSTFGHAIETEITLHRWHEYKKVLVPTFSNVKNNFSTFSNYSDKVTTQYPITREKVTVSDRRALIGNCVLSLKAGRKTCDYLIKLIFFSTGPSHGGEAHRFLKF